MKKFIIPLLIILSGCAHKQPEPIKPAEPTPAEKKLDSTVNEVLVSATEARRQVGESLPMILLLMSMNEAQGKHIKCLVELANIGCDDTPERNALIYKANALDKKCKALNKQYIELSAKFRTK